jgi:glycosidase
MNAGGRWDRRWLAWGLSALAACADGLGEDPSGGAETDQDGDGQPDPAGPERSCEVVIRASFAPGTDASVAGRFNEWIPRAMTDTTGQGDYALSVGRLVPGTYGFKFVYDVSKGAPVWETPPVDVYTVFEGGIENRALIVGDCELPSLTAISGAATADGALEATFLFERAEGGAPIDLSQVRATVGRAPGEVSVDLATGILTVRATGLPRGKHSVRLSVVDTDGLSPEQGQVFMPLWVEDEPFDWSDGVLYYAFLDRFRDGGPNAFPASTPPAIEGTDFMGGDLVGATAALEEGWFDALGVRSIWLSPVNDNPEGAYSGTGGYFYTGYHGYWPTAARAVEGRLGANGVSGEDALRAFVDAAHARGIRVMLDVVLNHVHEQHEYVASHPGWFNAAPCPCTSDPGACNWDSNPIGCWFTNYLPDVDYKNPDLVDQFVADGRWWVETFDIDGFRVDAAKHMDHVIMRTISMRFRDLYEAPSNTEFYKVGETFTFLNNQGLIMDFVGDHELDGQFDFPLYYAVRDAVVNRRWRELSNQAWNAKNAYGPFVHRMSPFMGNHDVSRIATDLAGCPTWSLFGGCPDRLADAGATQADQAELIDRIALAYTVVSTMPGVPLLYYGDEVGLAGAGDPDNRRRMPWGDLTPSQASLLARVQALGTLRTEHAALQRGEWKELWVSDSDDLFAYARDLGGGDVALVAMRQNWTPGARSWRLPIPSELGLEGVTLTDGLGSGVSVTVTGGAVDLTLSPYDAVVLVR